MLSSALSRLINLVSAIKAIIKVFFILFLLLKNLFFGMPFLYPKEAKNPRGFLAFGNLGKEY
jgi:hypothetical protein